MDTTIKVLHAIEPPLTPEQQLCRAAAAYPTTKKWRASSTTKETRHVLNILAEDIENNLTATALAGGSKISVPPIVFVDDTVGSLNAFYYLGSGIAGHSGILHGGITAVLLDECMGRASFGGLPLHIAVTASIEIEYLAPIRLPDIVLINVTTEEVAGRKAWMMASVESPNRAVIFAKAKALFVQPKGAENMNQMIETHA